jgi:hypothetical protein
LAASDLLRGEASALAARNLLLALSNWRPAVEAVRKKTALEEPKPQ